MPQLQTARAVGNRVMTLRKLKGLTLTRLSEMVQCSPQTLAYVERGGGINSRLLVKLCSVLNVSADHILGISNMRAAPEDDFSEAMIGIMRNLDQPERDLILSVMKAVAK